MSALRHRGQPLAALGLLLASWIGFRTALWEPPFTLPGLVDASPLAERARNVAVRSAETAHTSAGWTEPVSATTWSEAPRLSHVVADLPPARLGHRSEESVLPLARVEPQPLAPAMPPAATLLPPAKTSRVAAAHQLLNLAALGPLPLPPGLALAAIPPRPMPPPVLLAAQAAPRWSGDGWVLVRRGSGGLAAASGFPAYGASQAGGVVRFALAPGSPRAPQAYVRVSRAIGGFDEGEVAAGLSARPVAGVPLRLLGEARVQRGAGVTRVRPAVSLVSELPPLRLPRGIVGEAYAQAGYAAAPIGSKRGATPFFDVQAVADRRLAGAGAAELRIGAGAWSGGQEGAARLDLGPRASVRLDTGAARSRLALDWRFRVAGNARPASGPTLTFSAGF